VHGGGIKIEVAGRIRYPDAVVFCSPQREAATVAVQPVVVFEIVSPRSARADRIVKVREYGATESIRRYVILEQTSQAATVFSRMSEGWASMVIDGDVDLALPELGIPVPLAELHWDVGFPEGE
jgi:Uma2 family endonuclease